MIINRSFIKKIIKKIVKNKHEAYKNKHEAYKKLLKCQEAMIIQ